MTLALAKRETSYEDHEAAYLAELRPHGVLEMATAKTMAGIAWKIEEIDHAVAHSLKKAKEGWMSKRLNDWVKRKGGHPIDGVSGLEKDKLTLVGIDMWEAITEGRETKIRKDALAHAYLAICDYANGLRFLHWGEFNERELFLVPKEKGEPDTFDKVHEWDQMTQVFSREKVRFLSRYLESKSKRNLSISEMAREARFFMKDTVSTSESFYSELSQEEERLNAAPLPLDLALPEIEKARKLQKELANDLWREKERLDRMRAPSVTIEHGPLLDNLSL